MSVARGVAGCALALVALGCQGEGEAAPIPPPERAAAPAAASLDERATRALKRYVDAHVAELAAACAAICEAAPAPDADGWSAEADRASVDEMRARWRRARAAYERIEGAIAILFPETDADVDGRYERVTELRADPMPFDAHGFVGMHAVERILWASERSPAVDAFEAALPFSAPARTPRDALEARAFTSQLCARLVSDVRAMERELGPIALDPATAWRGIHGSIEEQAEKVLLGSTGEDESRYAAHTLADMRANLEGGRAALRAFAPSIESLPDGPERLAAIEAQLAALDRAYRDAGGDALPPVPDGFDPDAPSDAHLATPYGRLFVLVRDASDPRRPGSLAALLRETGDAMGIPPLGR